MRSKLAAIVFCLVSCVAFAVKPVENSEGMAPVEVENLRAMSNSLESMSTRLDGLEYLVEKQKDIIEHE